MQRAKPRKDHPDYIDKPCFIGRVLVARNVKKLFRKGLRFVQW